MLLAHPVRRGSRGRPAPLVHMLVTQPGLRRGPGAGLPTVPGDGAVARPRPMGGGVRAARVRARRPDGPGRPFAVHWGKLNESS